ncbi:MAG: chemotaxis protein CheW [Terriglobia bacterium]
MYDQPENQAPTPEVEVLAFDADHRLELRPEYQYLVFRAGAERYCLSVLEVEEVVEWLDLTPIPLAPLFLMGIFNLRGAIVPVLDIAYGATHREEAKPKHLVVASWNGDGGRVLRVGLAADEVLGTCLSSELLMVEETAAEGPHCCGTIQCADGFALALDLKRLAETFPIPGI